MRCLKKIIQTVLIEGKSWEQEMNKFLRNYRTTPHGTTGKSPSFCFFGRELKTRLPELIEPSKTLPNIRETDENNKKKFKDYADRRKRA